jgi:hypothetical protein
VELNTRFSLSISAESGIKPSSNEIHHGTTRKLQSPPRHLDRYHRGDRDRDFCR